MNLKDSERADVLLDFHFYNYAFCKDNAFTTEKTSCFFSILKRIIQADQDSNAGVSDGAIQKSFDHLKTLLFRHSVERPPHSVGIFSVADVKEMIDYVSNSYYRHFSLYKFIFTKRSVVQLSQQQQCAISEVRVARPLMQAMEHTTPPLVPPGSVMSQAEVVKSASSALLS